MNKSLLHKVIFVLIIVALIAAAALAAFVFYLIYGSYQGQSPSDVNGILFPIAMIYLVVGGTPLAILIAILFWGYDKTQVPPSADNLQNIKPF